MRACDSPDGISTDNEEFSGDEVKVKLKLFSEIAALIANSRA